MANTVDIHYGGAVILSVMPDDSSYSYEELMARDQLVLNFSLADYVEIPVGAWVEHGGKRYTLLASGAVTMHHTRNWEYSLTLEAGIGHLGKYIVHNTTDTDRRVRFDLTDKASRHIKLLVDNLNERDGDGTWSAGHVLTDETDTEKLVTYSQSTILEALNAIADAYGTEWSVSSVISGGVEKHTLTLGKVEKNTGADALTLAYGSARVGGLNSGIARNNAREDFAISRLFVQGGERNVALNMQYAGLEYGSKTLLLPKDANFLFDGQKFSDEEGYDETKGVRFVTDTEGRYVEVYGAASDAAEGSYDGSDTYPMRIGTISAVSTTPSRGDEAFVNIEDDTLGSAEGKEAIDYSDLGITGEQFTMVFQTGALAGKEFGVNSYKLKADCGYFELAQETIDGVVMPQAPGKAFAPKAGDKYAVFGMKMPDAYIAAAQKEMLRLATASLYVYRNAQFTLRDSINQQWAKRYWTELALGTKFVIGGYVKYYNEALFPDAEGHIYTSRITAVKRGLNNPYDIELTVSDKPGTRTVASEFKRIDDGEVHGKEERDGIIQYTKRSLRDTLETAEALMESKLAGYGDAISPIVVRTMQMIAGDKTLQFDLWTDRTCTTRATSVFAYDDSSKVFSASSCALRHLTIGIDDIAPLSSRKTEDYLRWTMSAFESAALTDSEARYYLYARVNASNNGTDGTDGTFVLSAAAIDKDAESGRWHLLVGILNRENDGTRSFVTVYGFTEVLPGQITTDIIRSADGRSFLNLLLNKFHLGDDVAYIDWNNFILNGLKIKGDVEADTLKLSGKKDSSGKTTVTADINGLMAMRGTDGEDITAFLDGVYGDGVIFGAAASDAFAKSLAFAEQEDDLDVALRPDFLLYRKGGKVKVYIKDLDSETTISLNAAVYGLQQQMSGKLDKSVFDKLFTVHYKEGSATEIESLELNYGTWTTGFLSVRGLDNTTGSGSGGTDLPAVWESLTKNVLPYQDVTINTAHIPVLPQSKVTGLPDALSSLRAGYTGISALIPQAATADNQLADKEFVNSSIATATATFRGTFATLAALEATPADRNDYAFWAHKDEDGNTCYDKYTFSGSAWKFEYRLNNSSFTAAQWGAINSGITGTLVTKLTGISDWALAASKPSYTTAEVTEKTNLYFTDARAKSALSGHTSDTTVHITAAERKAWNAKWDWNEASIKAVKVNAAGEADKLANSCKLWGNAFNGTADVDGDITLGSGKRIYFGSTSYYIELVNGRLHTNVGLYSDKFISARGSDPDAGGGSGASLPVVWASFQGNTDDYKDKTIHQAHIPTLPVSRIDGLATALAGKQPLISDLATIRSNAATAFGWGDHSKAGYITGITKAMVESVLTGNITSHTHAFDSLTSKPTTLAGYGIEDWILINTIASPDTFLTSGIYRVSDVDTSSSGYDFRYGQVLVLRGTKSSDTIAQIAVPYFSSNLYFRSGTVSNFTDAAHPWYTIYTSGNSNNTSTVWSAKRLATPNNLICPYTWQQNGDATGTIVLSLPYGFNSMMQCIELTLYNYAKVSNYGVTKFFIGGYNFHTSNSSWINPTGFVIGNNIKVRLGYYKDKCCILIGETGILWNYPRLSVDKIYGSFATHADSFKNNDWSCTILQDESEITNIVNATDTSLYAPCYTRAGLPYVTDNDVAAKYLKLSGGTMAGDAAISWGVNDRTDWDTYVSGIRVMSSITANSGAPVRYATGISVMARYSFQIAAQGGDVDAFFIRAGNRDWKRLLHEGNYSSFALPITGGIIMGSITMSGATTKVPVIRNFKYIDSTSQISWARHIAEIHVDDKKNFAIGGYGNKYIKDASDNKMTYAYLGFADYDGLNLRISETDIKWGNNAIYHAGNSNLPTVPWNCSSLVANGSVEAKAKLYGQCIEFSNIASSSGQGGFIDFHFNGSTEDYTSRIIEDAKWQLSLFAKTVRIGKSNSANLLFLRPSYNYIWTDVAGGTLVFGTIDGGVTSSSNSALFIKGKKVYIGGTETGNNALNVNGVAHATTGIYSDGYVSARGQDTSSDIRLKTDFRPLDGALKYIRGTHFTRFRWKDGSGESVGIIAQEEQSREYGFLVRSHGEIGHLTYDYAASTALLGAALQEEDDKVEALKRRVKELENELNKLKQSNYANR